MRHEIIDPSQLELTDKVVTEIIKEDNIDVDGIITYKESFRDAFMREVKK